MIKIARNPLKTIEWDLRTLLVVALSFQLADWGLLSMGHLGFGIPILQQIIGFIYLTFLPGILICRIIGIKEADDVEKFLYICGLSISFLMFLGLFMNIVYPILGISRPITPYFIRATVFFGLLVLSITSFIVDDKRHNQYAYIGIGKSVTPLLLLLPVLSIMGTYLVNSSQDNRLLMLMIAIIAILIILLGFTNYLPEYSYPLFIFAIAISLLYHYSLISNYLSGADIQHEYYSIKQVQESGIWDININDNINAMLSITILPVIYSSILNLDAAWILKIIYPFFFSLLPLGLYKIYFEQLVDKKLALFSVIYFVSIYPYFNELLSLARQEIAEFFLMLILLLFVSNVELGKKRILAIIFGSSLVVSHYGISYIFLFVLILGCLLKKLIYDKNNELTFTFVLNFIFVLFYIIISFFWYSYISEGSISYTISHLFLHAFSTVSEDVLSTPATSLITGESVSIEYRVLKLMYFAFEASILFGFVYIFINKKFDNFKFSGEYLCLSAFSLLAMGMTLILSNTGMNIHRLYHIMSIFLSVYCVIGGVILARKSAKLAHVTWTESFSRATFMIVGVILAMFLLLNCGFIQEISQDSATSVSLSQRSIMTIGSIDDKNMLYTGIFTDRDINSIKWLAKYRNNISRIYADLSRKMLPLVSYGRIPFDIENLSYASTILSPNMASIKSDSYIYLGYFNTCYGRMNGPQLFATTWDSSNITSLLANRTSLLYNNSGCSVSYSSSLVFLK